MALKLTRSDLHLLSRRPPVEEVELGSGQRAIIVEVHLLEDALQGALVLGAQLHPAPILLHLRPCTLSVHSL